MRRHLLNPRGHGPLDELPLGPRAGEPTRRLHAGRDAKHWHVRRRDLALARSISNAFPPAPSHWAVCRVLIVAASLHPLELVLAPLQWSYYSIMFGLRWLRLSSRIGGDIERCLTVSHCWHQPHCNAALPTQLAVGRHCQIDLGPGGGVYRKCLPVVLAGFFQADGLTAVSSATLELAHTSGRWSMNKLGGDPGVPSQPFQCVAQLPALWTPVPI